MFGRTRIHTRLKNPGGASFNSIVAALFASGEQGFAYDNNDISTLFQDSAGTTPVTAADQTVGLQLDKSKGMVPGASLLPNLVVTNLGTYDSGANTYSIARRTGSDLDSVQLTAALPDWYKITVEVVSGSTVAVRANSTATMFTVSAGSTVTGWLNQASGDIRINNTADASASVVRVHAVAMLPGNHRFQTAAASRPMLRYNATTGSYYLQYDGTDDFFVTNAINFTATGTVSVFAGVRKLTSDTLTGSLLELSANSTTTAGSFSIFAGIGSGASYQFRGGGTIPGSTAGTGPVEFPSPHSAVIVGVGDISADTNQISINGVLEGVSATDQGTGNYGNHPMYFGRRAGTSLPFNGHEYSPICVGRLTTAAEIANVERMLARQVGVSLA